MLLLYSLLSTATMISKWHSTVFWDTEHNYLQLFNEKSAHSQLFLSSGDFATSVIIGCCRTCNSNAFFISVNSHRHIQHDSLHFYYRPRITTPWADNRVSKCKKHKMLQMQLHSNKTSSSVIAERPRCRVGQFWPKVEDNILQTVYVYLQPLWCNRPARLSNLMK